VIKVGGGSEVEVGEIKDRVTDALCATKAAISEGIVSGGGTALLYASKKLDELLKTKNFTEGEIAGVKIIQNAVRIPCMRIAENAGFQGGLVVSTLLEKNQKDLGLNAATGDYVNMKEKGIIDPTKVVRTALVDASSVASLMLTTECMIFDEPEKKKKEE
jgi:chaperonin GroEL